MTRAGDLRNLDAETDIAVIGSGIGGLTCAALLAKNGFAVTVCESHVTPGGAAHGFERDGYHFESGPSFFTGLSVENSANPMSQVLAQLDERVECVSYDSWNFHFPEGLFVTGTDEDRFHAELARFVSEEAMKEWLRFEELMKKQPAPEDLQKPFSWLVDRELSDPFLRRLCDFDAFSLSGMDAGGTPLAEMHFMFKERFQASVDYPLGGSQAVVDALVRALEKHGGKLLLGAHVDSVIVEDGRAVGIKLRRGGEVRARRAVVSNAAVWDTQKLVPAGALPEDYCRESAAAPQCESILHLHLGIDATGLPDDLGIHHVVLKSWDVTAPQNMCNICIPSTLDPSLAPSGPSRRARVYGGERALRRMGGLAPQVRRVQGPQGGARPGALAGDGEVIPDVQGADEARAGGNAAHPRALPAPPPRNLRRRLPRRRGKGLPGPATPLPGLFCCGDSNMPGVGVPAVAVSGMMTAGAVGT